MISSKTKWKRIPFQPEIRKAQQLSFRILLFLLRSLDGIVSSDTKSVQRQCAQGPHWGPHACAQAHGRFHSPAETGRYLCLRPLPQRPAPSHESHAPDKDGHGEQGTADVCLWEGAATTWALFCEVRSECVRFSGNKIMWHR